MTPFRFAILVFAGVLGFSASAHAQYFLGPRGGCYTLTRSGSKRYVDRSMCQQEVSAVAAPAPAPAPRALPVASMSAAPAATPRPAPAPATIKEALDRIAAIERELAALKAGLKAMAQ